MSEYNPKLFGQSKTTHLRIRDYFATEAAVPLDKVAEYLVALRHMVKSGREIPEEETTATKMFSTFMTDPDDRQITLGEILEFRAYMKYQEADYMLRIREGMLSDELEGLFTELAEQQGYVKKSDPRWDAVVKESEKDE